MANTPDPLANNPAIRQWAERFYSIKDWTIPDPLSDEDLALEARRTAALAELAKISIGAELASGARRAFAGGRKALKREVSGATDIGAFDGLDTDIADLAAQIATQRQIALARAAAQTALAAAEAKFEAVRDALDQGAFTYLERLVNAARVAMGNAVSVADFEGVESDATDCVTRATEAQTYGAYFDNWTRATLALISSMPKSDPVEIAARDTLATARNTQMTAAASASKTGDFATAKSALQAWKSNLADEDDLDDAVAYDALLETYMQKYHSRCQIILASQLRDVKTFKSHLKNAKTKATERDYTAARALLQALMDYATPARTRLARYLRGFDMSMMPTDATFKAAMLEVQKQDALGQGNKPKAARTWLVNWAKTNGTVMNESLSKQVLSSLQSKYEALKKVLKDPELSDLIATWTAHEARVTAGDFTATTGAAQYLPKLEALFQLAKVADERNEIAAILAQYPEAAGFDFHTPLNDDIAAEKYMDAIAAVPAVLAQLRLVPKYLEVKAAAESLLAVLPSGEDALTGPLDTAIKTAAVTVLGDPVKATADLQAVLDGTDYLDLALAMADFDKKLKRVEQDHARIKAYLKLPEAEDALDQQLAAAKARALTDKEYGDAFLLLDQHEALLKTVRPMATARFQVKGIIGALEHEAVDVSTLQPFKDRITAAETAAKALEFKTAETAFEGIRTDLAVQCTAAAEACETRDGTGSRAGHSLDRHGPTVDDAALIERLKSGKPPNAKTDDERSFTGASSKFHSAQDWLAGRQIAAEAAAAKGIDLDVTVMTYTGDPLTAPEESAEFTVEHGRPIDKAFIGHKRQVKIEENSGEVINDKTYETFEEIEGLTRAFVNFIWEPATLPAETTAFPVDPTVHDEVTPQDNADYVKHYQIRHNTAPASIPGRWVMMQQFPVAEGWDNETKTYKNANPSNMIP
ncbi:hypothetical protein [Tritonibacter horizontis]|uniref:Uncharacterized protein n=1 Tax=Tritonibacter horizontis TaxID=1768241 RepID=A0A132BS30_9RHOB|nr:hypothetical protein [Tritonibacter horizontis]KUP90607.1 hypothetical protein TRIHO_44730 [Tritonibacter horizontis]